MEYSRNCVRILSLDFKLSWEFLPCLLEPPPVMRKVEAKLLEDKRHVEKNPVVPAEVTLEQLVCHCSGTQRAQTRPAKPTNTAGW